MDQHAAPARLPHRPALDGLRGAAVAVVLAFHLGYRWAQGGYLGVSVFFTLSGFLITSLLLLERQREGRIDLRRFWSRRARRLLPAALAGLLLAAWTARTITGAPQGSDLDVLAALGDVANWRFLAAGRSYGALFSSPSPALHFWSLSIEEQFYAVFPVLAAVALARAGRARSLLRACLVGIAGSWIALALCAALDGHEVAYYSTITRAGELLTGAVAAVLVHHVRRSHAVAPAASRARGAVELLALATLAVLAATVPESSSSLERGVLPLVSVLSAIVVVGCYRGGAVSRLLAVRPLTALGRISYGVYVYHWPLFLLLTSRRTGLSGIELTGVRLAATLAVAVPSFVLLERPVREGRWPKPAVAIRLLPATYALAAVAVVLIAQVPPPAIDFVSAQASIAAPRTDAPVVTTTSTTAPADTGTPAPLVSALPVGRPARVAVFGDSTALMMTPGLAGWGRDNGRLDIAFGYTQLGCSLLQGARRFQDAEHEVNVPACQRWPEQWAEQLAANPADIAVVLMGPWDVTDHRLPGDERWRHIGDPAIDSALRSAMRQAATVLLVHVQRVVWLTAPDIQDDIALPDAPPGGFPENDPARMARYNDMLRQLAREVPQVSVVDLNGYLRSLPGGEMDPSLRPDGVHFSNESTNVVAPWIGEHILAAAASATG